MSIDFAKLIAEDKVEEFVEVAGWSADKVRMLRPSATRIAEYLDLQADIPHEDNGAPLNHADAIKMAVEIISMTVADEEDKRPLDSDEGREFLARQSLSTLNTLSHVALRLAGIDDGYDDTKKN